MRADPGRDVVRRGAACAVLCAAFAALSCSSPTAIDRAPSPGEVAAVVVDPATSTLTLGAELPLQALVQGADGRLVPGVSVVWSVRDSAIAKVSAAGVVTALAVGSTQIAASANGKSGLATVTVQRVPVASVSVSPGQVQTTAGGHVQLTAITYDASGATLAGRSVVWSSSNESVATVDASGALTAVSLGTATITATSEGKSGAATVEVAPVPVASVTVTPPTAAIVVRGTATLVASVKDANGAVVTDRAVTWTSSDAQVATVSATGVVTGVAPGAATITATSEGKSGAASVTVSAVPVSTVSLLPTTTNIVVGQSAPIAATVKDAGGTTLTDRVVTWASSNVQIATVSASGVVTGVSAGTVTITATSEGKSGGATVVVARVPVGTVSVLPTATGLIVGQTATLAATVKDANGAVVTDRLVTWTSSNPTVATVGTSGAVLAVSPGSATITATSEGKTAAAVVTVTPVPVGSVVVSPSTLALTTTGRPGALTATVKDANGAVVTNRVVTWTTSNAGVATVSSAGLVTAVAVGTATITATSEGKSGSADVTVTRAPVSTVTLAPSSASLPIGADTTLKPTVTDANGVVVTDRDVTWVSSNTRVATVSTTGVVTAVGVGTATITATSEGRNGSASITVTPGPAATVDVSPNSASLRVNGSVQLAAVAHDAAGNLITGRAFTWTSSDTSRATVDSTGLVRAKKAGTVTITATMDTRSDFATIVVSP
jgi:uncharacterized protein YjdB